MKFLSIEKQCPVATYFFYISLAMVTSSAATSSKINVENSAKSRYVDEIHDYRFLKFEINKSNHFMKTMINHRKSLKQYQSI